MLKMDKKKEHRYNDPKNQTRDSSTYTYVFEDEDDMETTETTPNPKWYRKKTLQILPSVCASFLCIPFGIMLGWPSPTYPYLLEPDGFIPITLDQSAMIAGLLMVGNSVAIPFSACRKFGSKYGIIIGTVFITIGWILMWQATNIYHLLLSRFLVGLGHGYGFGQIKLYISEMAESDLGTKLIQAIPLFTYFGILLVFCVAPLVDFVQFGMISLIISIFIMFLGIFLPSTPRELIINDRIDQAERLVKFLNLNTNQIANIRKDLKNPQLDLNFIALIKNRDLRTNFLIFAMLVFFQQFTGHPATMIYSQILFTESKVPNPVYCAIGYSITFLISNILGIFVAPKYNKKAILIVSSLLVALSMLIQVIIILLELNSTVWEYISYIVMTFYSIVHTVGLGNLPFTYINELFPKNCTKTLVHYYGISHSILALIITKIFQVMYENLGIFTPFCLFLSISVISLVFVTIFVPSKKSQIGTETCTKIDVTLNT